MTVGELIEKLQGLPPSTLVATDDHELGLAANPSAYLIKCTVDRRGDCTEITQYDDGKSDRENVVLISEFGQEEDAIEL